MVHPTSLLHATLTTTSKVLLDIARVVIYVTTLSLFKNRVNECNL